MLKPTFKLTHKIPFTIYRREQNTFNEYGDEVPGAITEIEIEGNIQPVKSNELLQLPEADRTRVWFKLYTDAQLRTMKEGVGGWDADEFNWKGNRYKVMKIDDWTAGMSILEHTKNWCVRIELTPN